ncbi:fructosamine kinase family protein [Nocardia sp. NPDC060256]|uniref:fructosamine kinase family protein n=1 Tax=unclassified Nocardia TaxID=2637762 RepID=UPI0036477644
MTVADQLGALLGTSVRAVTDLGSSHTWTLHRATLADGRDVFVKASAEPTTVFTAEAAGLRWLATGPGAVADRQVALDHTSGQVGTAGVLNHAPGRGRPGEMLDDTLGRVESGHVLNHTPGQAGSGEVLGDAPGQAGSRDVLNDAPGRGVPGDALDDVPGRVGSGDVLNGAPGQVGSGRVLDDVPGRIVRGDVPSDAPGRTGSGDVLNRAPGQVASGAGRKLLPEVLAAGDHMIVLPWLDDIGPTPATAERFGRELAALHANSPEAFGAPWQGWIAELPLDNTLSTGPWSQWYAERRLAPYLPRAAPHLGEDGTRLLEKVIDRIDSLSGPPEPPARIHGDLWSGNILWTSDRAVLIDPAAHAGHRETDLAMLALFGAPHLDRIRAAYNETHPLAENWRTRVPLHQLHHLLVHVVLYGASYRSQTLSAASAALAV